MAGLEIAEEHLTAWGGSRSALCQVARVGSVSDCLRVIDHSYSKGYKVCNRASACSHADAVLNAENIVLDLRGFDKLLNWDPANGILIAEPGMTLASALIIAMPDGWVVPCAPGGLKVTLGGALSFDVHGKDGVHSGTFGDHVRRFKLLTANGDIIAVTRESDPSLFQAAIGGMGLLGVIIEIEIQLLKIPSSLLAVRKQSTCSVRESLAILDQDELYDYAIGWIDPFAPNEAVGRGYMTSASWSTRSEDLTDVDVELLFAESTKVFGIVDSKLFWAMAKPFFRPSVMRWANLAHYLLGKMIFGSGKIQNRFFPDYIYIHNFIPNVNSVYQPEGLVTVQPLLPRAAGHEAVVSLLHLCQRLGIPSMMAGLKRQRDNDRLLSFARDGYSFSIDILRRGRNEADLNSAIEQVYAFTAEVGGRIYLAKDDRLTERYFKQMYPEHELFWRIKEQYDPNCLFLSDQARRVFAV